MSGEQGAVEVLTRESTEQNATEGLTEAEESALFEAMHGWARDLCMTTETPIDVVERIVADRARKAVEAALGEVEQRIKHRLLLGAFVGASPWRGGMVAALDIVHEVRTRGGEQS